MAGETPQPRCLYIIGAQCTGKTTLVNALEADFTILPPPLVPTSRTAVADFIAAAVPPGKTLKPLQPFPPELVRAFNTFAPPGTKLLDQDALEAVEDAAVGTEDTATQELDTDTNDIRPVLANPLVIREVARTVMREKGFSRDDITTSPTRALRFQKHIIEAQLEAERSAKGLTTHSYNLFISDRSGLDPIIYAKLFAGDEAANGMLSSKTWKELERNMKAGVVMLCEAGCTWLVDDGTRLMPDDMEQWRRVDSTFREQLAGCGIPYKVIPKDMGLEARVQLVREHLRTMHWASPSMEEVDARLLKRAKLG